MSRPVHVYSGSIVKIYIPKFYITNDLKLYLTHAYTTSTEIATKQQQNIIRGFSTEIILLNA